MKQLMWIGVAWTTAVVVLLLDDRFYHMFAYPAYFAGLALLVGALLFGREVNGAKAWFEFGSVRVHGECNVQHVVHRLGIVNLQRAFDIRRHVVEIFTVCLGQHNAVNARAHGGKELFALHVDGLSMINAGILDGDYVIAEKTPVAENGEIVVGMIGDEATVKYFRQEGSLVVLTPKSFNPVHQPQIYDLKRVQVRVVGLVVECRKVF